MHHHHPILEHKSVRPGLYPPMCLRGPPWSKWCTVVSEKWHAGCKQQDTCYRSSEGGGQQITTASICWTISVQGSDCNDLPILFWFSLKIILGNRHYYYHHCADRKTEVQHHTIGRTWVYSMATSEFFTPMPTLRGECNVTRWGFCPRSPQGLPQSQQSLEDERTRMHSIHIHLVSALCHKLEE